MPSRKKLQGQSRKAKRANATTKAPICACDHHCKGRNWSKSDADAANKLAKEYGSMFCTLGVQDLTRLVFGAYNEYQQFNDSQKDLFRRMMLASGTDACVRVSNQRDLTKESSPIREALPFIDMMLEIEVRDKYNGAMNNITIGEMTRSWQDIACPRETVRFFHRRNHCDCLKELYYKLKESTQRTAECYHCQKVVDIRKLSRCEGCNVAQFCSTNVQLHTGQSIKHSAKNIRQANNMPTKLSESNSYFAS